ESRRGSTEWNSKIKLYNLSTCWYLPSFLQFHCYCKELDDLLSLRDSLGYSSHPRLQDRSEFFFIDSCSRFLRECHGHIDQPQRVLWHRVLNLHTHLPGPQITFSPISVTLSSGGPVSSTLSVSAASSGAYSTPVPPGNYNVNVTGTSGSLVHSATLALTIGSSSGAGALPSLAIVGVGIASAAAIVVAGVYFLRRRSK